MKVRKYIRRLLIAIFGLLVVFIIAFSLLYRKEIKTLKSLEQESPINMYSMVYYADYYFDEFLKEGAKSDKDLERFIVSHMTHGLKTEIIDSPGMCTSFVFHNESGEVLFGRNFDYKFSPVVMLFTKPESGYHCITASDIAFAGYDKKNLPNPHEVSLNNARLLLAPYLATDGMNEYGVAMSILDCGSAIPPEKEDTPTLNTSTTVRMVLENAKTIDEAVALMRQYNYNLGTTPNHFMIADSSGRAVVVEFCNGELVTVESCVVTNFDLYDSNHQGVGQDRYWKVQNRLKETNGILSEDEALELLAEVVVPDKAQYSVLYNLTTGDVYAFTQGDNTKVEHFSINMLNKQEKR